MSNQRYAKILFLRVPGRLLVASNGSRGTASKPSKPKPSKLKLSR